MAAGAPLCIRRPRTVSNTALFALECDQVETLPLWPRGVWALARHRIAQGLRWVVGTPTRVRNLALLSYVKVVAPRVSRWHWLMRNLKKPLNPALVFIRSRMKWVRGMKWLAKRTLLPKVAPPSLMGLDSRERHARHTLTIHLRTDVEAAARRRVHALGIADDARIVTMHVRESGFKTAAGAVESPLDATRNARIESYVPAIEFLVERGFTVVRIGDPYVTPTSLPGFVDLARSAHRSDALELLLIMWSELFLASDSGPFCIPLMTRTPNLGANITDLVGAYPFRAEDRCIVKHVYDRASGRQLTLSEMLTEEVFLSKKDLSRFEFIDNTAEEIRSAVQEMISGEGEYLKATDPQRRYHQLVTALQNTPRIMAKRVRQGEPKRQFLGDGMICDFFARRHLGSTAD